MMKKFRHSLAFLASLFAAFALPQAGNAQFFDRVLPIGEILYAVEERGFEPISRPRLRGNLYIVEVIDPRGRRSQLAVDASDGTILGSVRARETAPYPVYPAPRPVLPYGAGPPAYRGEAPGRVLPGVRDLRDPSTRGLLDPGSSVRIERVAPRGRDFVPDLPDRGPLPPSRPPEVAIAPPAEERDQDLTRRQMPETATTPEPTERTERQRSVIERTTPVPRTTPLRSREQVEEQQEQEEQAQEQQAQRSAARAEPEARTEGRAPTPRGKALLEEFSPDELDQLDMYAPQPRSR